MRKQTIDPAAFYSRPELKPLLPGNPSIATIDRMLLYPTRRRRCIPSVVVSGRRFVKGCDLIDYLQSSTPIIDGAIRTPAARNAAAAKAERELVKMGA